MMLRNGLMLLVAAVLTGCQYGMPMVDSADDVYPGQIVVVGKVVLDPALQDGEQDLSGGMGAQENLINLFTSRDETTIDPHELRYRDYKTVLKAPLGETFFSIAPFEAGYVTGATIFLAVGEQIYFPGGWRFEARERDRAVYLGTIKYRRNEFYEIVGVEVIDEYRKANSEFVKKFGTSMKLRKALLTKVK